MENKLTVGQIQKMRDRAFRVCTDRRMFFRRGAFQAIKRAWMLDDSMIRRYRLIDATE